jgi:SNF2 family DNA or RNA helicase
VQVHKYVCAGTFEEALDRLIQRKLALSEAIVGAGESWITELAPAELREMFSLRTDVAVAE